MDGHRIVNFNSEFWESDQSHLILDPQEIDEQSKGSAEQNLFQDFFYQSEHLKAHVWIASSGSTSDSALSRKLIGLSKKALLTSAENVNNWIQAYQNDVWGLVLPQFHVGGLSIWARAYLSKAKVIDFSDGKSRPQWQPVQFVDQLNFHKITLTSLVPTQVFDLVEQNLKAPSSLRVVFVGGGGLQADLYRKARLLGWPLLPSFGMTEACSQVATAPLSSLSSSGDPVLEVLPHFSFEIDDQDLLALQGPSMLSGFWQQQKEKKIFVAHQKQNYFWTEDRVRSLGHRAILPLGRRTDYVKILGEGVDVMALQSKLQSQFTELSQALVIDVPDQRKGSDFVLVVEKSAAPTTVKLQQALKNWNQSCHPVERIQKFCQVEAVPRSSLGKVMKAELRKQILDQGLTNLISILSD